jgi:hypothetical protein
MIFVVLYLTSAAVMGALAATPMRLGTYDPQSPEVIRFSFHLGYAILLIPGMLAAGVMVATTSLVTLRTRVLPAWFGWSGVLVAVLALLSAWWVPAFAIPIWLCVASLVLLQRPRSGVATPLEAT